MENNTHQDETIWAPGTVRLEDSKYDTTIEIQLDLHHQSTNLETDWSYSLPHQLTPTIPLIGPKLAKPSTSP